MPFVKRENTIAIKISRRVKKTVNLLKSRSPRPDTAPVHDDSTNTINL
jgi:hypothetical protein